MGQPRGSAEIQNFQKRRAIELYRKGWKNTLIADAVGVTARAVQKWIRGYKERGDRSLDMGGRGVREGTNRMLSDEQESKIEALIFTHFPSDLNLPFLLWSRQAVQELIRTQYDLNIAINTVGDYLARWGYTAQRPAKKAYEQNDVAVCKWLEIEYPKLQTRAVKEHATIYWGDESRCQNQPGYCRGYAPVGETPTVSISGKSKLSINFVSCISNRGDMRFMTYGGTMNADMFIIFLERIVKSATRKVFLILDNLRVHHSKKVAAWVEGRKDKIELHFIPAYSPELNPDEYLNQDLKRNVHKEGMPKTQTQLEKNTQAFLRSVQRRPEHVASYFRHRHVLYAS